MRFRRIQSKVALCPDRKSLHLIVSTIKTDKGIVTYYDVSQRKIALLPGPFNSAESPQSHKRQLYTLTICRNSTPKRESDLAAKSITEVLLEHV